MNVIFTRIEHWNVCSCMCQFCAQNLLPEETYSDTMILQNTINYLHLKVVLSVFSISTYQCNMKKINFYKTGLVFKFQWLMKNMNTFEQKKIKL